MLEYIIYFVFILSVAFAAGGVVISNRLRTIYKYDFLSTLMYYQVFIYTFGFYGIWGQVIISAFMKDFLSPEVLIRISDITILLGLPFLVFAWIMLLKFSRQITGKSSGNRMIAWFSFLNFALIFAFGYIITKHPEIKTVTSLKYYFISFNFIYTVLTSAFIIISKKRNSDLPVMNSKIVALALILIMLVQDIILYLYTSDTYVALGFIFSFFAGNSFFPLYLSYGISFSLPGKESVSGITFDQFYAKYDISPREQDIIREVYNGLSNKEIADKLFISLQTVKDHTHRIYTKTNVRSRVHLINLIREIMA